MRTASQFQGNRAWENQTGTTTPVHYSELEFQLISDGGYSLVSLQLELSINIKNRVYITYCDDIAEVTLPNNENLQHGIYKNGTKLSSTIL